MKCLDAQRMIRPYLNRELSEQDLEQFLAHVESCADCMEELEISLALQDALADDFGADGLDMYDIRGEVDADLRSAHQFVHLRKGIRLFRFAAVSVAQAVLLILLLTGVEMKLHSGKEGTTLYRLWSVRHGGAVVAETETETQEETETEFTEETEIEPKAESKGN